MSCVPHIFNGDSHCSAATSGRFSSQKVQRYAPSMSKSTIINQDKLSSLHLDLEQKRRQNHTKAIKNKALHGFAHEDSELREGQREGKVWDPAFREGADERIFAYKHRRARAVSEGRGDGEAHLGFGSDAQPGRHGWLGWLGSWRSWLHQWLQLLRQSCHLEGTFCQLCHEACGRGGKDFWARHWWHWPKRSARKAGEGAWTIQTIPLERCSKRNRRDPLCSCLQCQADKWGSKSAITPAGTSSSISLGAGWGRGRWEGHLELVGLGFAGEEIHWSWAERHGRLWHGVRLGFGQGGRPDRPMGQFASEVGGWEDGEIEGVGIIWNSCREVDDEDNGQVRKAARPSISRQTSDDMESIMEEEEDEHEELISGIGRWACLRPFCGWLFLRLQMKRPMSRSCYLACGVRGDAYTCQRRQ